MFEQWSLANCPQVSIPTEHLLHAGMYARTIHIPAGTVLTGACIKVPTILVLDGEANLLTPEGWVSVSGHTVWAGSANRKQMCFAITDLHATMIFPTRAQSVDEAEQEFTDDFEQLMTRKGNV